MDLRLRMEDGPADEKRLHDLLERVKLDFLSMPHPVPHKPDRLSVSTVIIRKRVVPFYHAIYSHPLQRFVELHVPMGPKGALHVVPLPQEQRDATAGADGSTDPAST